MTNIKKQTTVKCPACNKPVPWISSQKWKPFCSERCKLIDLGEWVNGSYHIPCEDSYSDNDEF